MTRVAIVTTEPTASRVPQFDLLSRHPGLELMVFYAAESASEAHVDAELDHPHEILRVHIYRSPAGVPSRLPAYPVAVAQAWIAATSTASRSGAGAHSQRNSQSPGAVDDMFPTSFSPKATSPKPSRAWARGSGGSWCRWLSVRLSPGSRQARSLASIFVHFGADPDRVRTFANTVDVDGLAARADDLRTKRDEIRARLDSSPDVVVVLYAARLLPIKGVDVLVAAAAHVGGVKLLIVGDGPERAGSNARPTAGSVDAIHGLPEQ